MKKYSLIIIIILAVCSGGLLTLQSCTKVATIVNFNLNMRTQPVTITIPATSDTDWVFTLGPATSNFSVDSFVQANTAGQFGAANITSARLSSVDLVINNATVSNNFQDLQSCYVSFYSNTNTTPYTLSVTSIPDVFASSLSASVDSSVSLRSYLGTKFTYTLNGKLRHATTMPLNCTITFTYALKVAG